MTENGIIKITDKVLRVVEEYERERAAKEINWKKVAKFEYYTCEKLLKTVARLTNEKIILNRKIAEYDETAKLKDEQYKKNIMNQVQTIIDKDCIIEELQMRLEEMEKNK